MCVRAYVCVCRLIAAAGLISATGKHLPALASFTTRPGGPSHTTVNLSVTNQRILERNINPIGNEQIERLQA